MLHGGLSRLHFPAPVTAVIAISLLTGCSAEQTGPILIASVVAFTITGGTGVSESMGMAIGFDRHRCRDIDVEEPQ
jgi:hypothetical protein